jgi:CubicO group peptidase (beta-lactamase class C family)
MTTLSRLSRRIHRLSANSTLSRKIMRTFPVPDDLGAVTDIDPNEIPARQAGLTAKDTQAIWAAVEDVYCTGYYPAISMAIRHKGHLLLNRSIGYARGFGEPNELTPPQNPEIMRVDTPACLYSATKAITAILIHKLADDGLINILDPVAHYIPEFGKHGKDRLNILQILTHRGGVPGIRSDEPLTDLIKHERQLELICDSTPLDMHGRVQAYHPVTGGTILKEILERVTGKGISAYWEKHFKKPLDLGVMAYGASPAIHARMARDSFTGAYVAAPLREYFRPYLGIDVEKDRDFINNYAFYADPIPAGNMVATAEEANRFFQMLLDQGRYGDRQIISPNVVKRATWESTPHTFDNVLKVPLRYSPGMMLGGSPIGLYGPETSHAFGHLGMMNIMCWADPERDLSVSLITTGKPIIANNLLSLVQLLRQINNRVPRHAIQSN